MDDVIIAGVELTPLKKIFHPFGDVFHAIKRSEESFIDFGEAYFTTIKSGATKSWKKHLRMTLNLIVPIGKVRFVIYDDRRGSATFMKFMDITLSIDNYFRITVPPNVWMAFKGIDRDINLILNIADFEHDPKEIERLEISDIFYPW